MKIGYSALVGLLLVFLTACVKQQTLSQRETSEIVTLEKFLKRFPTNGLYFNVINKARNAENDTWSSGLNMTALKGAEAIALGANISQMTNALGFGLLMDVLNFNSPARRNFFLSHYDIMVLYYPTVVYTKRGDDYIDLFDEGLAIYAVLSKGLKDCHIEHSYEGNYVNARTYHIRDKYRDRMYVCEGGDYNHRFRVTSFNDNNPRLFVRQVRIPKYDPDVATRKYVDFILLKDYDMLDYEGWGVFYNKHDENNEYEWTNFYRDEHKLTTTFSPYILPIENQRISAQARLKYQKKLIVKTLIK